MRKVLHLMGLLTDEDMEWITSRGQLRFVPRGTTIIREGEPIDALSILLEGKLSVTVSAGQGRTIAVLYPGEVLGEMSFVDARPPSATVTAIHDSHVLMVSREALDRKMLKEPDFAARFYKALAVFLVDRLRTTSAHLGYGMWKEDVPGQIDDAELDDISLAGRRFDDLLKRLRVHS
jgi:CRP-like cAMP-binding protein